MKKHLTAVLTFTALATCTYFTACKSKKEATTVTTTTTTASSPTYTADIKQILDINCANSCHSTLNHARNIDLSTYETAKEVAAHPNFLGSIWHQTGFTPMPGGAPQLDGATISKLSNWVNSGMPR